MKIYYAHHLWKYNTEIEKYEISLIQSDKPGCTIFNPNGEINPAQDEESIMAQCVATVDECDALVFSDLSGAVGRGVVSEIERAEYFEKPVGRIVGNGVKWYSAPVEMNMLGIRGNDRIYAEIVA